MKKLLITTSVLMLALTANAQTTNKDIEQAYPGYKLVFHDEFDKDGRPDPAIWRFETGFVRNHEAQYYQSDNATVKDGNLVIEARKESVKNDKYVAGSSDWKKKNEYSTYTSASMVSRGQTSGDAVSAWKYGRFCVRAKLPCYTGCWPAIWLLGTQGEWPYNGEVDMMEYYPVGGKEQLHANVAWGSTKRWSATWNSKLKSVDDLVAKDPQWKDKFHVWRMDWDKDYILLYVDDELINATDLSKTVNPKTDWFPYDNVNPYHDHYMYLLLNLALGGDNGGSLSNTPFPCQYLVDYVRIYQKDESSNPDTPSGTNLVVNGNFEDLSGITWTKHETWSDKEAQSYINQEPGWQLATDPWNVYADNRNHGIPNTLIAKDNKRYLRLIRYTWNGWGDGDAHQTISHLIPGHQYQLSFLYRFSWESCGASLPVAGCELTQNNMATRIPLEVHKDWTRVMQTFTAQDANATIRLFLDNPWHDKSYFSSHPNKSVHADFDEVTLTDITTTTAIHPVIDKGESAPCYSLTGQRLSRQPSHGIFVQNGKKVVR